MSYFLQNARDAEVKGFMQNIIGLYDTRKMMQPAAAFNIISDLVSHDKRSFSKGIRNYHKAMTKYATIEPLKIRLDKTRDATIVRQKLEKVKMVKHQQTKAVGRVAERFRKYQATKKSYLVDIIL